MIFYFLIAKYFENYFWALQQYRNICIKLNIRNSIYNIINYKKILINTYNVIFLNFKYILYV